MNPWEIYENLGNEYANQLGSLLFIEEQKVLEKLLWVSRGFYGVQLGYLGSHHCLATPFHQRSFIIADKIFPEIHLISDFVKLPFADHSVDMVFLPHILEFHPKPQALLKEISRILTPSGSLILICFNSLSLWGFKHYMKRLFSYQNHTIPWNGRFYTHLRVQRLLENAHLNVMVKHSVFYRPALKHPKALEKWLALEKIGKCLWSKLGASNIYCANKQIVGITQIPLKWTSTSTLAIGQPVNPLNCERE